MTVALIIFPRDALPLFKAELLKGFKVQFGGIGTFLLHPGGLSEDVIAIGLPVLLLELLAFPAKLNMFGEAGLRPLYMVNEGGVPELLLVGNELTVPGGTLIMLPGGGVPLLLPEGGNALVGGSDIRVLAKAQPDTQ